MSEFSLITQYFTRPSPNADLGVGDDAALIQISTGHQLAVSADMLISGTHFLPDCPAYFVGWKSLAVNISDMAAMGASPKWATLAISLPEVDHAWLSEFSKGFFACAEQFNVSLIGGDTTRGPLSISVQIMGEIPLNQALQRDNAQLNDDIWVSGTVGEAALGLKVLQGQLNLSSEENVKCIDALQRPEPRVSLGLALRNLAHSAIDISDGLLADLGHILEKSKLGAKLDWEAIPKFHASHTIDEQILKSVTLAGGDDYELCFTAPSSAYDEIKKIGARLNLSLSRIGTTDNSGKIQVLDQHQNDIYIERTGYDHFN